jgi:polysaccharide deacetylase 2 family uncharacterized protein YibQ
MKADFTVPQSARPFPSPAVNPLPHEPLPQELPQPAIAIIIDDLGNQWQYSQRALALHKDITLAILPFSPFGERLAQLAEYHGREVILHAPMEPLAHPAWRDGLRRGMSEQELRHSLANMLDNLPTVRGVNNHMGSALTQERTPMDWVMRELAQRDLYFIDSRTSPGSQALASARQHAIPSARRDVFLDNVRSPDAILAQFNTLVRLAHKRGQAIAIGHPYPETLAVLEQTLPQLGERGVRLVPASHLLDLPTMIETAADRPLHDPQHHCPLRQILISDQKTQPNRSKKPHVL